MPALDINHRGLSDLIARPATKHLLSHISHQASLVLPCHSPNTSSVVTGTTATTTTASSIPPLHKFINLVVKRAAVCTGTLVGVLVYLDRLQQRLAWIAKGMPCSCQRIFLATLIVTTKVLHDASPRNKHWVRYAVYFTLSEINLMERQLLLLMNYEFDMKTEDLYRTFIRYENSMHRPSTLPDPLPENKVIPGQKLKKKQHRGYRTSGHMSTGSPYWSSVAGIHVSLVLSASSSSSSLETSSSSSLASISSMEMNASSSGSLNDRIAIQNLKNATEAIVHNKWIDPSILYPAMPAHQNHV
ncbi:hypothetical protein DFQ30_003486 [Apophysomyces sp. BC1015]|nr:hypothetical protein DFQ30_003486 [Apophysomyces sp. BC1015]